MSAPSIDHAVNATRVVKFEYAPRVRVEWIVAATRVALAAGALVAIALDPLEQARASVVLYLLAWYLAYSLGMLGLVWAPIRFGRGWDLAVHLFDFTAFSVLIVVSQGATSPFFMCFLFLLVCGTLRWQLRGTLWTAAATMGAYAGISVYAVNVLHIPGFELNTLVIRAVYLTVITVLLAYLSAHQHRFQNELSRIAAWPRGISRDPMDVVSEVLSQASALLDAPKIIIAWEEPGEGGTNLAWQVEGRVGWAQDVDAIYSPFVLPALRARSFQALDAAQDRGRVVVLTPRGFGRRDCRPINEALRTRFEMRAVQSWPLDGELIRGRIFCLDKTRMRIDDLLVGQLVAQLATSRIENLHAVGRLRDSAAFEERLRVARDLHDSLLQSQAGAALHLLAARRLLDRQPDAARQRLKEVQDQLERGELEMRSFIRELRPPRPVSGQSAARNLSGRLEELRQRIERQSQVAVELRFDGVVDLVPDALQDDVYRLAQEALVNAARHAEASAINMTLSVTREELRLEIVDDGRGFPFHGTYDLLRLNEMNEGPLTLKERVADLAGDLTLKSMATGTAVRMTLPLAHVSE
jgi:signal transduction histidine kinase